MKANSLLAGLLAGALIGAVAGILAAPKSGKDTRGILGSRATDIRNRAGEYVENIKERFSRSEEGIEEPSGNGVHTHG